MSNLGVLTVFIKGGHRNLSTQLAKIADHQIDCGVRTKKSCGTAIAGLQSLTSATLCSLLSVPLLSPFPQIRMVLKINQKYF
jgi:hypothetical protein